MEMPLLNSVPFSSLISSTFLSSSLKKGSVITACGFPHRPFQGRLFAEYRQRGRRRGICNSQCYSCLESTSAEETVAVEGWQPHSSSAVSSTAEPVSTDLCNTAGCSRHCNSPPHCILMVHKGKCPPAAFQGSNDLVQGTMPALVSH